MYLVLHTAIFISQPVHLAPHGSQLSFEAKSFHMLPNRYEQDGKKGAA
jgi:hypothetical protein